MMEKRREQGFYFGDLLFFKPFLYIYKKKRSSYFLTSIFLLVWNAGFTQGLNHAFLIGYDVALFDTSVTSTKARLNFDSNNFTLIPETRKMAFSATQATISDANGNLIIVSNGCWVANATGDTMLNGSGLNPGLFASDWCSGTSGIPFAHANLILPFPGDSNKYFLFHQTGNYNLHGVTASELFYSVIDMTLDGGLGGVTFKNQILFNDTLSQGLAACKHANGRDWWIVALKDSSKIIYKLLLTPDGIISISTQELNVPLAWHNGDQPTFSPDGNKFAYTFTWGGVTPFHDVRLFHFDRCTGLFSDTTYIPFYNDNSAGLGIAFSPDSKYLYHCSFNKIFQINTDNFFIDTVAINDGYFSPYPPFQTDFWLMYLAANGKIYISSGNSVIDMHYINYPDSSGLACDVHQHGLHLPCYYVRGNVYHPNYYLGPVNGSVCDTLGLSVAENNIDFHIKISPNPNTGNFIINYTLPQNKSGTLEIFDVLGKRVYAQALPTWSTMQRIDAGALPQGVYVCFIKSEGVSKGVKWVKE